LATHSELGIYNFTNPGSISHNEVLTLYRDIVCPTFTWQNFSLEEQSHVIKAGRSNCMLDTGKLERKCREYGIDLGSMEIKESMRRCFERMREAGGERDGRGKGVGGDGSMKGLWMGKENQNRNEERVGGGEMV
jgi:3,5-epimerase/4-reductase